MKVKKYLIVILTVLLSSSLSWAQTIEENQCTPKPDDPYTLDCGKNFLTDYQAVNPDLSVNIVIEIPAGTLDKWEVMHDGILKHDMKNGKPRIIKYQIGRAHV